MRSDLPFLTREEMISRGAYGFLGRAYEGDIPVSKVVKLGPEPTCQLWGAYSHAGPGHPVEVKYSKDDDVYLLFAGGVRLKAAITRGETYVAAFIEPDNGEVGESALLR